MHMRCRDRGAITDGLGRVVVGEIFVEDVVFAIDLEEGFLVDGGLDNAGLRMLIVFIFWCIAMQSRVILLLRRNYK